MKSALTRVLAGRNNRTFLLRLLRQQSNKNKDAALSGRDRVLREVSGRRLRVSPRYPPETHRQEDVSYDILHLRLFISFVFTRYMVSNSLVTLN